MTVTPRSSPKVVSTKLKCTSTFEPVDEILWFYHLNETSSAVLSHASVTILQNKTGVIFIFVYCLLRRKGLLFLKPYLFLKYHAVRSEYQKVVQNSQKGPWPKTTAYSYAYTIHKLKDKQSSFFILILQANPKTRGYLWFCTECDESVSDWEFWTMQGGIFRTIPVGEGMGYSLIFALSVCATQKR